MAELTDEQRAANYLTHKGRYSDSSLYDEVCTRCGARDFVMGPDELSERPCPQADTQCLSPSSPSADHLDSALLRRVVGGDC